MMVSYFDSVAHPHMRQKPQVALGKFFESGGRWDIVPFDDLNLLVNLADSPTHLSSRFEEFLEWCRQLPTKDDGDEREMAVCRLFIAMFPFGDAFALAAAKSRLRFQFIIPRGSKTMILQTMETFNLLGPRTGT